eukprot:CAMPEP_0176016940 /NCGR_PEP_ID=MMETSP0120_2-20121206/8108_1 /TAXON_ID=160619 /ORGANISM="Kryptoperidinium foliaceum, Strain CCMP 1326" /LENGTH=222 /DNA_ID=CAMNT_0017349949 /DNA_START=100 /DNA_END=768 /DNA_ORIENTATION=-
MRALSSILFVFNAQKNPTSSDGVSPLQVSSVDILDNIPFLGANGAKKMEERNILVQELLREAKKVGQVGSMASEEDRARLENLANNLIPYSEPNPAKFPLEGTHRLVYSAAPGASSGKIGNFVGKVTQLFETEDIFYNRVAFGPLMVALQAKREVKNSSIIKVSFLETRFSLFGKTFSTKQAGGGGTWKVRFVGEVQDENGEEKLVRIMETPSLFILEQPMN